MHRRTLIVIGALLTAIAGSALVAAPALAQSASFTVQGQASPYLAGMPLGSTCCSGDSPPGQSPVQVTGLPIVPGQALSFVVTGSVSNQLGQPPVDPPDGSDFFETPGIPGSLGTVAGNGIASMVAPLNALVGVFLDNTQPDKSPTPPGLNFQAIGTNFASLCPGLKQPFFIGDGLTGGGAGDRQQFIVPAGATRFFLGTVDGLGWGTNSGTFQVQVTTGSATVPGGALVAAVLPASRSVQVGGTATAFATIINAGPGASASCRISPATSVPGTFFYQTTNPATNALVGAPNTPAACISPGASQSYVLAFTPSSAFGPGDVAFNFVCDNSAPAPVVVGLDTLLLSASTTPTPDVIALAATQQNDGIVNLPGESGTGAFAVATSNIGAGAQITVKADTGGTALPIALSICQTNPGTGQCVAPPGAQVNVVMNTGSTPTFTVFATGGGFVGFNPAANRIFVRFTDAGGAVRGATSVAVRTQ
jgi:hypothetical protein